MKLKNILKLLVIICLFGISLLIGINEYVIISTKKQILSLEEVKELNDVDCIMILGAGLKDNKPSPMLKERLDTGYDVYMLGISNKMLMTGDHTRVNHDEVNAMKKYTIDLGIKSNNIFMDHAGVSTYDSMYRAKELFGVKKIIIVTQGYHLYRSLYIAKSLGIEAYGVDATKKIYGGQRARDIREILARIKDFIKVLFKPSPSYLGKKIDISNNGNITNDNYVLISNDDREVFLYANKDISNIQNIVSTDDFKNSICNDSKVNYDLEINGIDKYVLEIINDEVHIVLDNKEIKLDEKEAKLILDLLGDVHESN